MAEFEMPSLGADMDEGTLAEWLVKPGEVVERGQIVAVIETQKGAIDVEIFDAGVILELLVAEGTKVPVGTALALYLRPGEDEAEVRARAQASPVAPSPAAEPRRRVSPRARKLAAELGVALDSVTGTGAGGSITGDDVRAAAAGERPRPRAPNKQAMRQAIAAAMTRSKSEIPHYYLAHTVDLEPTLTWLEARNRAAAIERRILPVTLWVRALASALASHRGLNGHWRDGAFIPGEGIHVGLAVALRGGGLVNPALRDADRGSLDELGARVRELSSRARSSKSGLRSSELGAATVTLTNLGDRGVDMLVPIIEPPQVAIIGVGTPRLRPWVVDGEVVPRRLVELTLSADHRASDGHLGARFLQTLASLIRDPERLEPRRDP